MNGMGPYLEFGARVSQATQEYVSSREGLRESSFGMYQSTDAKTIAGAAAGGCDVLIAVGPGARQPAIDSAAEFRQVVLVDRDAETPKTRPSNVALVSVDYERAWPVAGQRLAPVVDKDEGYQVNTVIVLDRSVDWQQGIADQLTAAMPQNPGATEPVLLDVDGMTDVEAVRAVEEQLAPAPDHTRVVLVDESTAPEVEGLVAGFDGSASAAGAGADVRVDYPQLAGRIALSVGADLLSAITQVLDAVAEGGQVPDLRVAAAVYPGSYETVK